MQRIGLISIIIFHMIMLAHSQGNSISFSPSGRLCIGEEVQMVCYVVPPPTTTFALDTAYVSFNGSFPPASLALLNTNGVLGGVDLSRYSANTDGLGVSTSRPGIRLIITSYIPSDSNTLYGCHGFFPNTSTSDVLVSGMPMGLAGPPTAVTLSVSLTSLLPATCSGVVRVAWTPGATDRPILSYSLSLNGDTLGTFSPSVTSNDSSLSVATDMVYRYSVTASSCAGISTPSYGVNISVQSYSLVNSPLYLSYDKSTGMLTVDWGLVPGNEPLLLGYSLQLNYSHSQYGTTNEFTNSSYFSLISGTSLYSVPLTPHSFPTADGVVTNITACIAIASQCGTAFNGNMICGFFNSENPPTTTQPTTATTINEITSTPAIVTTGMNILTTEATQPAEALPVGIIAGAVGGGAVVLFILIIILVVIMLCICCGKKSEVSKYPDHRRSDDNVELSGPGHSTDNIYPPEATYSQINKSQKTNTADLYSSVHKQAPPEKELLYADLDIVNSQTGRMHPPVVPHTQYTDLAQFPAADQTLYASVHTDGPN